MIISKFYSIQNTFDICCMILTYQNDYPCFLQFSVIQFQFLNIAKQQQTHLMEIKKIESQGDVYQRLKLLGQGAFGKAYLVKEKSTGTFCVIKQMNIAEMSENEQKQTFKEAKILEALNHPNIVKFKEVYVTTNHKLNIVMEYADAGDLSKRIKEQKASGKSFDEVTVLDWFTQMCLAIKHVHDRKIIHRDIKGQNIFITKNSTVKLGDFGIAKILNKTMEKAKTVVGTPYYLSPEIIQNKPYSFKTDIWSMGVVLYQLCMLAPPFNAGSLQYLALKIVKGSYTPLTGTYSKELKNLVADMLNLDPNKRPSADQILKLPFIINRIQKFLTETQNKVEFSHTVLHDFKLGFNKDKNLIHKSREKGTQNKPQIDAKQAERERLLLKQRQAQMEKMREEKRKQQKLIQQKKRKQEEALRLQRAAQAEEKKKEDIRKLQQKQQEYRQQQARLQYQRHRLQQQQQKLNKNRRRQTQQRTKRDKQQQQKRYLQFAKQEYFRNKMIKQNAERRANEENYKNIEIQQNINYEIKEPANLPKPNFHYKKSAEPDYKVEQRPAQRDKQRDRDNEIYKQKQSVNQKPVYNQQPRPSSRDRPKTKQMAPQVDDEMLMNAYMNPNFQKKQQQQQQPKQITPPSTEKKKDIKEQPVKKQQKKPESKRSGDLKSVIEQRRMQMRQDKEKFKKQEQSTDNNQMQPQLPHFKQSPKKQQPTQNQQKKQLENKSKEHLKTIRGNKWSRQEKQETPKSQTTQQQQVEQIEQIIEENKLLQQMIDKEIQEQQQSEQQLNDLILELKKIVGNVVEQVEQLPSIQISMTDNKRKDDEVQPQKAPQFEQKTIHDKQSLKYFSDYSKLEQLRMNLQNVFETETFVKLYRIVENQFQLSGMEGLQHSKLRQKVPFINQNLFSQYITTLMALIVIQNKIDEESAQ